MDKDTWQMIYVGIGIVVSNVGITYILLKQAIGAIKHHCGMQKEACTVWRLSHEVDQRNLRQLSSKHGHQGLKGEDAKVTFWG